MNFIEKYDMIKLVEFLNAVCPFSSLSFLLSNPAEFILRRDPFCAVEYYKVEASQKK